MGTHLEIPNHQPRHYEGCNFKGRLDASCTYVHDELADPYTLLRFQFPVSDKTWNSMTKKKPMNLAMVKMLMTITAVLNMLW